MLRTFGFAALLLTSIAMPAAAFDDDFDSSGDSSYDNSSFSDFSNDNYSNDSFSNDSFSDNDSSGADFANDNSGFDNSMNADISEADPSSFDPLDDPGNDAVDDSQAAPNDLPLEHAQPPEQLTDDPSMGPIEPTEDDPPFPQADDHVMPTEGDPAYPGETTGDDPTYPGGATDGDPGQPTHGHHTDPIETLINDILHAFPAEPPHGQPATGGGGTRMPSAGPSPNSYAPPSSGGSVPSNSPGGSASPMTTPRSAPPSLPSSVPTSTAPTQQYSPPPANRLPRISTGGSSTSTGNPPPNALPRMKSPANTSEATAVANSAPPSGTASLVMARPLPSGASGSIQADVASDIRDLQRQQASLIRSLSSVIPNSQSAEARNATNAINNLREKARRGTLTPTDIQNASNALQPFIGRNPQLNNQIQRILGALLGNSNALGKLIRDLLNLLRVASSSSSPRGRSSGGSRGGSGAGSSAGGGGMGGGMAGGRGMPTARAPQSGTPRPATPAPVRLAVSTPAAATATPIILMNPGKQSSVRYRLTGAEQEIKPGHQHKLSNRDSWLVEFDRGGSFGNARYQVTSGTYKFVSTDRGWDLVKKAAQVDETAPLRPAIEDEANLQRR